MPTRDRWCQLRMSADELEALDHLVSRKKAAHKAQNRADVIRSLVYAEIDRLDRAEARSRKNPD